MRDQDKSEGIGVVLWLIVSAMLFVACVLGAAGMLFYITWEIPR